MAQVYIRNNRARDMTLITGSAAVTIPGGTQGPAGFAPGYKRVDASFIEEARKNILIRAYFDEGYLVIEETPEQREKAEVAARTAAADEQAKADAKQRAEKAAAKAANEQAEAEAAQRKADEEKAQAEAAQNEADEAAAAAGNDEQADEAPAPTGKGKKQK